MWGAPKGALVYERVLYMGFIISLYHHDLLEFMDNISPEDANNEYITHGLDNKSLSPWYVSICGHNIWKCMKYCQNMTFLPLISAQNDIKLFLFHIVWKCIRNELKPFQPRGVRKKVSYTMMIFLRWLSIGPNTQFFYKFWFFSTSFLDTHPIFF